MGQRRSQEAGRGYYEQGSDCEKEIKKKLYWYTTYGAITLKEQIFYQAGLQKTIRAFSPTAGIHCRGYSSPLQRVITDFGGEHAFGQVEMKLKEHYGITVPTSSARLITQRHAHEMHRQEEKQRTLMDDNRNAQPIILAETDGSMIPMVKTKSKPEEVDLYDARKHKVILLQFVRHNEGKHKRRRTYNFGDFSNENL